MTKIIFYLFAFTLLFISKLEAQETFEVRTKKIAEKIEKITNEEKKALKMEVEAVNIQLEKGIVTKEQAEVEKKKLAQKRAENIENKVASAYDELRVLVQDKVENKNFTVQKDTGKKALKVIFYYGKNEIKENVKRKDSVRNNKLQRRRTTQFVLASGFDNLVTNNKLAHSDYGYLKSQFLEWGFTYNYRILKDDNLLHLKYGITGVYNELYPTDDRYFVKNGNQTVLQTYPVNLKDNDSYFKNVYITIPMYLEFDFSKKQEKNGVAFYKTQQSFRFGLGGFVGYQTNSKQFLQYDVYGLAIKEKQKGNFNTNKFTYGLSSYVGYQSLSLYLKYDLNPLFKDNIVKQNNISLGLRFDFN